ncbi:MAG: ParB/RepB/Spo0J family partition protein [Rikenellaceae bacterium]|nr:ParB/RepB/Spo0J family partition protein [Rikenellaceae bacterium]
MGTNPKNKGLGRGLGAIFELDSVELPEKKATASMMQEIEITAITPNPSQPRTLFDEETLNELANSIRTLGVITPITVKKEKGGKYTIISGERRWRASQIAGLAAIPAYVREVDDQTLIEMALVENIQRQDLNAIEVAQTLQRLIDECNLTQDVLASRVGKKRSTVANYMRLLRLPEEVQLAVREELITMGHAKALAAVEPREAQVALLRKVIKKHLSVRQTEELAAKAAHGKAVKAAPADEEFPESYGRLVEQLERFFTQDISIKKNNKGGGRIVIDFDNDEDIDRFIGQFEKLGR